MKVYSKFKNIYAPRPNEHLWAIGAVILIFTVVAIWLAFVAGFISQWLIAINQI